MSTSDASHLSTQNFPATAIIPRGQARPFSGGSGATLPGGGGAGAGAVSIGGAIDEPAGAASAAASGASPGDPEQRQPAASAGMASAAAATKEGRRRGGMLRGVGIAVRRASLDGARTRTRGCAPLQRIFADLILSSSGKSFARYASPSREARLASGPFPCGAISPYPL